MPRARKTARPARRPARRPRRQAPRPKRSNVAEWASLSENKQLLSAPGNPSFAADTMFSVLNVNLANFARALSVSAAYQFYRIKNVRLTFKSPFDTFSSATSTTIKPQLYYMIDKSASVPIGATLATLKSMGARPVSYDEKNFVVNWSPSILVVAESAAGSTASEYKISPWLSTEANNINHLGIYFFSAQGGISPVAMQIDIEVQFEFKKPLWVVESVEGVSPVVATPALY